MDMQELVNALAFISRYNGTNDDDRIHTNGYYMSSSECIKNEKIIRSDISNLNNGNLKITKKTKLLTELLKMFELLNSKTMMSVQDVKVMQHITLAVRLLA